jgi:DNA-binding LytR/AlgR family response regulator
MGLPADRLAIRLSREERRLVDIADVYYLEADAGATLVRLRGARTLRDVRRLPVLLGLVSKAGFVRIHRNHAVNLRRVRELRRQRDGVDWEVRLEPPVNRVLPVSRGSLPSLLRLLDD